MNKNEKMSFLKGKGAAIGIVVCFMAVLAVVGTYTVGNYKKDMKEQMAKAEKEAEQFTEDNTKETTTDEILLPEVEETDENEQESREDVSDTTGTEEGVQQTGSAASNLWFSEESVLTWPASGAVINGYSMDETVFFQTLEQYQYNPAMIIAGEAGETINASAAGTGTAIEESAQTGLTVTLDMGNGYSAVYGQLKDVQVKTGDYVAAGSAIGSLNEPTKYYSVEGTNLYFQVLKDGEPVDPMNFME